MVVNSSQVVVCFDVDNTLVRRALYEDVSHPYWLCRSVKITNPYDRETYTYIKHEQHIELLKQYKGRGFYIIVWSANGVGHAQSVIEALGLGSIVDMVMTKPMKHVDDRTDPEAIIGNRVFIPEEGFDVV